MKNRKEENNLPKCRILLHVEFFGPDEELEILDNAYKEMANVTDGLEFDGRLTPMHGRYHFTYFFKADSYAAWEKGLEKVKYQRDKKKLTRGSFEFYSVI